MDLLAPWKLCLQCLPVFSSEPPLPPPPSKAVAALSLHVTSDVSGAPASTTNSSENDFQEGEKPSFSDSSLTHDHQHQDLPLSDYAKEVGSPIYAPAETKPVAEGDEMYAEHDANQVVHDVEFGTSGLMPLLSPITPTPIGLGYIVGQHTPSHHIHHQVKSQHTKGHSFFHSHRHDKTAPLHPISGSSSSSQFEGEGGKQAHDDTHDDGFHALIHPPSMASHGHDHHTTTLPLETSHSTPADIELTSGLHGKYDNSDEDTVMNGSSSTLKTSQSEPIDGVGTVRVRRRDQLKHQLKDLRNQLKQGGHHLKEEGSKHLQTMVSTMNKQAQQIEESGSFFMVPRNHDTS